MTTQPNDRDPGRLARIVDLGKRRRARQSAAEGLTEVDTTADPDAETVAVVPAVEGELVDPPDPPRTLYTTVTGWRDHARPPLVAGWLRSAHERRLVAQAALDHALYCAGVQAKRTPKYVVLGLFWAVVGLFKSVGRACAWASAEQGNWALRQAAANRGDLEAAKEWRALDNIRERQARWRWPLLIVGTVALAGVVALLMFAAPSWWKWVALTVAVPFLARAGRPADKPILSGVRVDNGPRFVKLTAEQVRTALVAIGAAKEPDQVTFPAPGIHRDGPGWLSRTNLPQGITAVKIMGLKTELSSALRLPVDQVWPSVGPDHAGQLDLWVGYVPSSKMGHSKWALASPAATTSVFEPIPFGVDERMRAVSAVFFQRNFLIGGQPGSGKTFAGRALALGALLDPTVEMWLAAFKPSEDFYDISPFCTLYECGLDDVTMDAAVKMVADGLREVRRRQELLGKLKREGRITEGRTDPTLARLKLGLHPLVLVFDEVHELFLHSKQVAEDMIRLVKQGRSAGVIVILITQVASKDSVPPELTRCVSSRWCLSVSDQVANDQIMGTGAYKRGQTGTAFRPRVDAGWGAASGLADDRDGPVRAYYPNDAELQVLLDRVRAIRAGRIPVTGPVDAQQRRDILTDVLTVFAARERGLHWDVIADRLTRLDGAYVGITAEVVSARLRALGVESLDVKAIALNPAEGRATRKGAQRHLVTEAIDRREDAAG